MTKISSLILFFVSLALPTAAPGQEVVTPNADIPIRESPPGNFFQGKGSQIGTATPGDEYRVLEERDVPTIVGVEKWLKVEPLDDPSKSGWAYGGPSPDSQVFSPAPGATHE